MFKLLLLVLQLLLVLLLASAGQLGAVEGKFKSIKNREALLEAMRLEREGPPKETKETEKFLQFKKFLDWRKMRKNKGKPYASYDGPIPEEYREIVEMFRQAKTNQDASSLLLDDEEYDIVDLHHDSAKDEL